MGWQNGRERQDRGGKAESQFPQEGCSVCIHGGCFLVGCYGLGYLVIEKRFGLDAAWHHRRNTLSDTSEFYHGSPWQASGFFLFFGAATPLSGSGPKDGGAWGLQAGNQPGRTGAKRAALVRRELDPDFSVEP